jgi:hypothetical protein
MNGLRILRLIHRVPYSSETVPESVGVVMLATQSAGRKTPSSFFYPDSFQG